MNDVDPPSLYWTCNSTLHVYPPVAGGPQESRTFKCVECGLFESMHEGPGLTPERIAEGFRDLWSDPLAEHRPLDVAVFEDSRVVALIRRRRNVVSVLPVGDPAPTSASSAPVVPPAPGLSEFRDAVLRDAAARLRVCITAEREANEVEDAAHKVEGEACDQVGWRTWTDLVAGQLYEAEKAMAKAVLFATGVISVGDDVESLGGPDDWEPAAAIVDGWIYVSTPDMTNARGDCGVVAIDPAAVYTAAKPRPLRVGPLK